MGAFPLGHGPEEKRKVGEGREVCEKRRVMVVWWSLVTARGGKETGKRKGATRWRWVRVGEGMKGSERGRRGRGGWWHGGWPAGSGWQQRWMGGDEWSKQGGRKKKIRLVFRERGEGGAAG